MLATYNGAAFLEAQLDSLAAQTMLPFELVVGDDGSSDDTLAILERFAARAPFPVRVGVNPHNLGFADNFLSAASRATGDWIAFCDQDDAWYGDKLEVVANAILEHPESNLIIHSLDRTDVQGNPFGDSIPVRRIAVSDGPFGQRIRWSHGGCAMIFRANLIRSVNWRLRPEEGFNWAGVGKAAQKQWPHDRWISLLGNLTGPVIEIDRPLGIFRRHERTVSGMHSVTLSDRIRGAAGAQDYMRGHKDAREVSAALRSLASSGGEFAQAIRMGADAFSRLAQQDRLRYLMYSAPNILGRLSIWREAVRSRLYFSARSDGLGLRLLVKDLIFGVFRLRP